MAQCKDCKYLDFNQKSSVGYVCTNTNRRMVARFKGKYGYCNTLSHLKASTTPACKTGFERKEQK